MLSHLVLQLIRIIKDLYRPVTDRGFARTEHPGAASEARRVLIGQVPVPDILLIGLVDS